MILTMYLVFKQTLNYIIFFKRHQRGKENRFYSKKIIIVQIKIKYEN